MLKVKKIMELVIPQTASVSENDKNLFKAKMDDGAMYYESSRNTDFLYPLFRRIRSAGEAVNRCPSGQIQWY